MSKVIKSMVNANQERVILKRGIREFSKKFGLGCENSQKNAVDVRMDNCHHVRIESEAVLDLRTLDLKNCSHITIGKPDRPKLAKLTDVIAGCGLRQSVRCMIAYASEIIRDFF